MVDSVSDRFSVLKDHEEKLLLQGTRCNRFPFWQVFGAFCPCRHLRLWYGSVFGRDVIVILIIGVVLL